MKAFMDVYFVLEVSCVWNAAHPARALCYFNHEVVLFCEGWFHVLSRVVVFFFFLPL